MDLSPPFASQFSVVDGLRTLLLVDASPEALYG